MILFNMIACVWLRRSSKMVRTTAAESRLFSAKHLSGLVNQEQTYLLMLCLLLFVYLFVVMCRLFAVSFLFAVYFFVCCLFSLFCCLFTCSSLLGSQEQILRRMETEDREVTEGGMEHFLVYHYFCIIITIIVLCIAYLALFMFWKRDGKRGERREKWRREPTEATHENAREMMHQLIS